MVLGGGSGKNVIYWKTQLPIDYIDTTLVINTWETVTANLSGGKPCKINYIIVEQTNNGATAEDLEIEITINGTAYTWSFSANSGTPYYLLVTSNLNAGDFSLFQSTVIQMMCGIDPDQAIPLIASSVGLIRVRQTTAVDGTAAQIELNLTWEKLVGV